MAQLKKTFYSFLSIALISSTYITCGSGKKLNIKEVLTIQREPVSLRGFVSEGNLTLDLSNKNLSDITDISNLVVNDSKNKKYEDITRIKKLRLVLAHNKLFHLPSELKKLNLWELDLSDNKLDTVPKWVLQLKGLKYLYLGGNKNLQKPTDYPQTLKIIYNKYNSTGL